MSQLQQAAQPVSAPAQAPTQTQAPASNPLDQLKDIHLPEQIDQFPIAIGWWILLIIIIFISGYVIYRMVKYKKAIRLIKPANIEITALRNLEKANAHSIATLSALLKRVCLIYFPHENIASLNGEACLNFLNQQAQKDTVFFSHKNIHTFSQTAYQANSKIDLNEWVLLLDSSEKCIESIIKTAAKNTGLKNKRGHQS